jgi:hypothetical protein
MMDAVIMIEVGVTSAMSIMAGGMDTAIEVIGVTVVMVIMMKAAMAVTARI